MNGKDFEKIFSIRVDMCKATLLRKSAEYSSESDKLHNFKVAAALQGCTPERALGGFLAKHVVSIFDLINSETPTPQEVWDEKLGDALNYLFLLDAIVQEEHLAE
jgi:hypothetical protein